MKYKLALMVLAAAVLAAPDGRSQESPSTYYPLKVGSTWTYRAAEDQKVIVKVAKAEQLKIVKIKGDVKVEEKVPGVTLEVSSGGRTLREQVAVLPDGVYRFSAANKEVSPPLCILKFPLQKDKTWQVDSMIGDMKVKGTFRIGEAEITVLGKKYKCVTAFLQDEETGTDKIVLEYYFAPNVGIVKQHAHKGNIDSTIELEKYEP